MFKKTMTFDDLDGNEVSQTFYFNFNKKEIAELLEFGCIMEYADPDKEYIPIEKQLELLSTPVEVSGLSNTENNRRAYSIFQDLILDAYGVKGEDNVSFNKTAELRHYWSTHVAFPEMIFEFLGDEKLAAEFIENCLPPRLVARAKEEMQKEHEGQLKGVSLAEMSAEAHRRQQDPATRIEPGPEAAREAIGEDPEIVALAQQVKNDGEEKSKSVNELTEIDILEMDDDEFKKLDPRLLSKAQIVWAWKRRSQS